MGAIQKQWAKARREQLMQELGPVCRQCGSTENLSFDCIIPQGDRHHRMDTSARMSFYNHQHRHGNVQILCLSCNSIKGCWEKTNATTDNT